MSNPVIRDSSYRYEDEEDVIWLESAEGLPYLREVVEGGDRTRRLKPHFNRRIIAYTRLKPNAKPDRGYQNASAGYRRRYWYISSQDPYQGGPIEAVDPKTIIAGQPSRAPTWDAFAG